MNKVCRVGLVGAGKRARSLYIPLLKKLEGFDISGFTCRTQETRDSVEDEFEIQGFDSISDLCKSGVDFLITCVRNDSLGSVIDDIIKENTPFLCETPIEDLSIAQKVIQSGILSGVIEQWPYLPIEQFKKMIIDSGLIGDVFLVENDGRMFDYHGIALTRNYMRSDSTPIMISATSISNHLPEFTDNGGNIKNVFETWECGFVKFSNDETLIHKFSYNCKSAPFRTLQSVRAIGKKGSIVTACIDSKNSDYEMIKVSCNIDGSTDHGKISVDRDGEIVKSIHCEFDNSEDIVWKNPHPDKDLCRHSIGILSHLERMKECLDDKNVSPLYTFYDSMIDMMIIYGIKQSAHSGQPIGFR